MYTNRTYRRKRKLYPGFKRVYPRKILRRIGRIEQTIGKHDQNQNIQPIMVSFKISVPKNLNVKIFELDKHKYFINDEIGVLHNLDLNGVKGYLAHRLNFDIFVTLYYESDIL